MAEIGTVGENIFNTFNSPQAPNPFDKAAFAQALEQHSPKDNPFSDAKQQIQKAAQKPTPQNSSTEAHLKQSHSKKEDNEKVISKQESPESTDQEIYASEEALQQDINAQTSAKSDIPTDLPIELLTLEPQQLESIYSDFQTNAVDIEQFIKADQNLTPDSIDIEIKTLETAAKIQEESDLLIHSFVTPSLESESDDIINVKELENDTIFVQAVPIQAPQQQIEFDVELEKEAISDQNPMAKAFEESEVSTSDNLQQPAEAPEIVEHKSDTKHQDTSNEISQVLEPVEQEQLAQATLAPAEQVAQQFSNISAQPKDSNLDKAKTPVEQINTSKTQKPELSIVESVKVTDIQNSEDSSSGMSFEFNQKTNDFPEFQSFDEKLEELNVSSRTEFTKISSTKSVELSENSNHTETKSAVEQIKEAASTAAAMNAKKISIALTPKNLGSVEIELSVKAGNISSVDIKVEKQETLAMFIAKENSAELESILKGVNAGDNASLSFSLKEGNHGASQDRNNTDLNDFSDAQNGSKSDDSEQTARSISAPNRQAQQGNVLYL